MKILILYSFILLQFLTQQIFGFILQQQNLNITTNSTFVRNFGHVEPEEGYEVETQEGEPLKYISSDDLPKTFEWWDVDGVNYLTVIKNQHIPQYCGSCWSFATTSSISDRIKIMRKAAFPDINIAPQVLLTCGQYKTLNGCAGGYPLQAYKWIYDNNITDETCSIYQSKGWTNPEPQICTGQTKCQNCNREYGCFVPRAPKVYAIESYGKVSGEEAMMNEIYQRGPISCEMGVTDEFLNYTSGVFVDTTGHNSPDHDVSIVGWGEENGQKYWLGRNSWGSYWGIKGMFKLLRGENNLGVENDCSWAVPLDTWTQDLRNDTWALGEKPREKVLEQIELDLERNIKTTKPKMSTQANCSFKDSKKSFKDMAVEEKYKDREVINIKPEDLPSNFDWRDKDGVNYMSWTVNQHIPEYCGSCWGQAAMSAVADRVNILRKNQFPQLALSPQVLINCNQGGTCEGGFSLDVYKSLAIQGVPEMTCQVYVSKDPENFDCSPIQNCQNCAGYPDFNCWAQESYDRWFVESYGSVSGPEGMKKQIMKNGPITCRIAATLEFDWYEGKTIYSQKLDDPIGSINHAISVVGWGTTDEGQEYWIGRNSWGTYWGDFGYFYMQMHEDNLAIEYDCSYAIPILAY